jgi:serine/threonine-protein kinase
MLNERYRIVGLLGKGGMGEVYRADDLKLRQPVALKFLPEALSHDPHKLDRFHHEVRVARQVSHANVCRVYDIGEADGQQFISMEYIDGEDLAKVLRRMGRPSKDKAVQIARQLCAGLAAAHDKGVLHRDLKPHNVMIDGQGRVRITDFGLAGFIEDFAGREALAGTPAYMAPEQLEGRGVSVKSDIYALGLVLCELFTGKRVFDGVDRAPSSMSRSSAPTSLASLSDDIDPAIERVILRCLEHEPSARPSSALAVAAALPGGDPLAAALAAGETPDPSMVAAAGGVGGMRPALAVLCLVVAAGCLVFQFGQKNSLHHYVPLPKAPAVLADRAEQILQALGHDAPVADRAWKFLRDPNYLDYIKEHDKSATRWDRLKELRPSGYRFWYRQSPRELVPAASRDDVTFVDPPLDISGMAGVVLDPIGRLLALVIAAPQRDDTAAVEPKPSPDWSALFELAGVEMGSFSPAEPQWSPRTYCDSRAAWTGSFAEHPDEPIRIEAGAYRGKATFFKIIGPWTKADRMGARDTDFVARAAFFLSILGIVVVASIVIARRNLRMRRGDRVGANRLALAFFVVTFVSWMLSTTHVSHPFAEFYRVFTLCGKALAVSATLWLLYIAMEPYLRKHWPHMLISWTRLLAGRFRDPLVGRDMLAGAALGGLLGVVPTIFPVVLVWLGAAPGIPLGAPLGAAENGRFLVGRLLQPEFVWFALFIVFMLLLLRLLLRSRWAAMLGFVALLTVPDVFFNPDHGAGAVLAAHLGLSVVLSGILLLMVTRFGVVTVATWMLMGNVVRAAPSTLDTSAWYSGSSYVALFAGLAVIGFAFHTALGGRALFRDELSDQPTL